MAILEPREATLTQDVTTRLYTSRFAACRLTLTGISGEFTEIPFKYKRLGVESEWFEASFVRLSQLMTFPRAQIFATTPEGVGSLDIIYEIRTRGDA